MALHLRVNGAEPSTTKKKSPSLGEGDGLRLPVSSSTLSDETCQNP